MEILEACIQRPDRVSPWEIEPYVPSTSIEMIQPPLKTKRPRHVDLPPSEIVTTPADVPFWYLGSVEGQTRTESIWPGSLNLFQSPNENKSVSMRQIGVPDYNSPVSSRASNGQVLDQVDKARKFEAVSTSYRLFGIDLRSKNNNIIQPPENESLVTIPEACDVQDSDSLKEKKRNPLELTNQKDTPNKSRTRTKVQMQGVAVGRAVDLTSLEGYDDLIFELEKMFEIKGELRVRNKWEVVYTDDEGDMMLVGDDPWQEFCEMAKKIYIYTSEEVKKMRPRSKTIPLLSLEVEGTTTASFDSELKSET